ncbi:MAG: hypothetical protein PHG85_06280 [Candidatus Altiarchaeota archaeon]|nr:hypothetical protein [Candidatus Altiarchaeota archaeon]
MTHKPVNAPVVLPAGVAAGPPALKAPGEDLASFREKLRLGRHFFVVDDSRDACDMHMRALSGPFGGRGGFETDSRKALDSIAQRASKGELDVLVVDMDMPDLSGRELLLNLAKRGVYVPFVIVSGGQGSDETRAFMSQVSGAGNVRDLQAAVDRRLKQTGGLAFTYLRKEDVALRPELLLDAVDAMLLAGGRKAENLDLLVRATKPEMPDFKSLPKDARERLFASMSDACLNWVALHGRFLKDLDETLATATVPAGKVESVKRARDKISWRFQDPDEYSYDKLVKMDARELGDFEHDLFGSQGVTTVFNNIELIRLAGLTFQDKGGAERMHALFEGYTTAAMMFKDRFGFIQQDLKLAAGGLEAVDLRVAATMTAPDLGVKLGYDIANDRADVPTIEINKKELGSLEISLKQALVNAGRAVEGKSGGKVSMVPGVSTVDGLQDAGVKAHFRNRGYGEGENIASLTIKDNGPGMPAAVLEAWHSGGEIHRGGGGEKSQGLGLMRESAGSVNDGRVVIESSPDGTAVTFYFAEKLKDRQKS